jgi:hypothetical protein
MVRHNNLDVDCNGYADFYVGVVVLFVGYNCCLTPPEELLEGEQ